MTTEDKCKAILEAIVMRCNNDLDEGDPAVGFGRDWGKNTLTLFIEGSHSHVGVPGGTFEQLVDSLHGWLCEDQGLSLAIPLENPEE